jgi:hypothetical protein
MTTPDQPAKPAKPSPDSRDARLKAALRANLQRRKAQARGRDKAAQGDDNDQDEG